MKDVIARGLRAAGTVAFVFGLLGMSTGCGALKAAANPKVAWALKDPAPMSVVVRRADVAQKTAENVDKILTDTPMDDDSPWLTKVTPEPETAKQAMADMREGDLYAGQPVKIVQAEYWAKSLAKLDTKSAPKAPVASKDATAAVKADKKSVAAAPASKKAKGAPVAAAAPVAPAAPKYASLLAAVDKDLGEAYGLIMEQKKAAGEMKVDIATHESAMDADGVSDADKKEHKAQIAELEKTIDAIEKETNQHAKDFIPKAKAAAQKAPADMRDRVGPTLVTLRQAVDDANTSAGAAAVRYPMAITTLKDSVQQMAVVYVADVIEEQTGKRPSTHGLVPGITLEGGSVDVTLNGISSSDLGKMSMGDLTKEVASRTAKWVKHTAGLLGSISGTKDMLEFEDDVLGAILDGFKGAGWAVPKAVAIPDAPAPQAGGKPNA